VNDPYVYITERVAGYSKEQLTRALSPHWQSPIPKRHLPSCSVAGGLPIPMVRITDPALLVLPVCFHCERIGSSDAS